MGTELDDSIDDVAADDADAHRQKSDHDANCDIPEDNCGAGLPHEVEHRGNILEGTQTVAPRVAGAALNWRIGCRVPGLAGHLWVVHGRGHISLLPLNGTA